MIEKSTPSVNTLLSSEYIALLICPWDLHKQRQRGDKTASDENKLISFIDSSEQHMIGMIIILELKFKLCTYLRQRGEC